MLTGFRNCHAPGVHSIALGRRGGRLHRVFIAECDHNLWHNAPFSDALSVGFHAHHCDLKIRVLAGQIGNLTLCEGASRCLTGYRYQSALRDGAPGFSRALLAAWYGVEELFVDAGGELELPAAVCRTVWVARGESAVWLVEEGDEDPHYLPITFSDVNLIAFDWTGMYAPLAEAECANLLRRYAPELLAAHVAGQFADADAQKRAEVDFRVALAESEERARTAKVRLSQAEEHLIRQEEAVCQVEEMVAAATERALILTKENEEAQRQIARLRRDAVTYDSRISALLSSEHALREQVATLRRREAERVSDPEGLEDIARQARNNLTEDDLDVLDRHRAALWDAGGARVGQPLSMALAVLTRLIRWKEAP